MLPSPLVASISRTRALNVPAYLAHASLSRDRNTFQKQLPSAVQSDRSTVMSSLRLSSSRSRSERSSLGFSEITPSRIGSAHAPTCTDGVGNTRGPEGPFFPPHDASTKRSARRPNIERKVHQIL